MPTIRVGVNEPPQSAAGQIVDLDYAQANVTALANIGTEPVSYSTNGGNTWTQIAAAASAVAGNVGGNQLRMRRVNFGGYPVAVDMTLTEVAATGLINGVAIGELGTGIFAGLKLVAGDDFDTAPTRFSPLNPTGKYAHSALAVGFRRTQTTNQAMYIDPSFRGARSQSPVDLGYDRVVQSGSKVTFTASAPEAGIVPFLPTDYPGGDGNGRPYLLTGSLKTGPHFMISAKADFACACAFTLPPGVARGWWPSFWTTTNFWPDGQEFDIPEIRKNGSGVNQLDWNLNGNTTDGGANAPIQIGPGGTVYNVPDSQVITVVGVKSGTSLRIYDDAAVQGTLQLRNTYTNARVARFKGAHDLRLDLAVANAWDSTTFSAGDWPKSISFEYWQAWAPAAAGPNTPTQVLTAVNTTPGGSWAATLPATTTISGGKAGLEEVMAVFCDLDTPGNATRDSTTKLPGGMSRSDRTLSGTVPTTEGGRIFIMQMFAFDDGTPVARALLPINVAPAAQGTLFNNLTPSYGAAVNQPIAAVDFHSGNLGPHTYNVTKSGGSWLTITGNGTSTIGISGTAPGADETVTLTINCTNSIGQTTTVSRTVTVSAGAAWTPAAWTTLRADWNPEDNTKVFSDNAATTQAVAGTSQVAVLKDSSANGYDMINTVAGATQPAYITDALVSKKAIKFTAANLTRLSSAGAATVATGTATPYTVVMAVRRGTPGVSGTPSAFARTSTQPDYVRHFISGANAVGATRTVNGTGTTQSSTATMASDAWYVLTFCFSGSGGLMRVRVNGVAAAAVTIGSNAVSYSVMALGALFDQGTASWTLAFGGAVGRVFLSTDATATSDVTSAETFIAQQYGITF